MTLAQRWLRTGTVLLSVLLLTGCPRDPSGPAEGTSTERAPVLTAQPADAQVVVGGDARFETRAQGNTVAWSWQRSTDGGTSWSAFGNPVNSDSGNNSSSALVVPGVNLAADNSRYRAVASNTGGQVTSSVATLTVLPQPTLVSISVQPQAQQVSAGGTVTFAVTVSGTSVQYQWQSSPDGSAWTDVAGARAPTLQLQSLTAALNGTRYRVTVVNTVNSVVSSAATLTVVDPPAVPAITSQPTPAAVTAPQTATFSVSVIGQPAPSIQWQRSTGAGAAYTNIAGATAERYTTPATSTADDGTLFRAVATNSAGTVTSEPARLSVAAAGTLPQVTAQPQDLTVAAGQAAVWSATVSGTPTPALQWQLSVNGGAFANINGATGSSYSLVTTLADNGSQLRLVATNSQGSVTSRAALLTAQPPPSAAQRAGQQGLVAGSAAQPQQHRHDGGRDPTGAVGCRRAYDPQCSPVRCHHAATTLADGSLAF